MRLFPPSKVLPIVILACAPAAWLGAAQEDSIAGGDRFRATVLPVLQEHCYDCHGDGESKGSVELDQFRSDQDLLERSDLWWKVLKNLRAGIMPPERKPRLSPEELERINAWVVADVFGIDPADPDPGRQTVRRLNRVEYRNTIRDLMGVDFDTETEFPPDDTGYGFDNIGDVLSISPLLLEKYVQAAETIVSRAVPTASKVMPEQTIAGRAFKNDDDTVHGDSLSFYNEVEVGNTVEVNHAGRYRLQIEVTVDGEFGFDPGRCRVGFSINGNKRLEEEYVWAFSDDPDRGGVFRYEIEETLAAGTNRLTLNLHPLVPVDKKLNRLDFRLRAVSVKGPFDERHWVRPPNYDRFFPDGPPPDGLAERRAYAGRLLQAFSERAYRRPVDPAVVERLVDLAESIYSEPGQSFEAGVARAQVATLASPRFLFRTEGVEAVPPGKNYALVDEYALASRLSYFFWSTMPDEELTQLAKRGQLREQLPQQVKRMLQDPRSGELIRNFTGQWLQARNIDQVAIEPLAVLGFQEEADQLRERFGRQLWQGRVDDPSPELEAARARMKELRALGSRFNPKLREAMRRETEMLFEHVMREDRSLLDFIDSDYTFLNAALAENYGISGVEGEAMRWVRLPADSPRGGVLTQGTMLLVTSNPTRTSPVKRGLYILENILGTPTPPAPPNIPTLEETAKAIADHQPTLREVLARHREDALCRSCHARIDPLGLAFENFTALGTWRDQESNQPLDVSGELITGESFQGVRELKGILKDKHQSSFYRCLTEKLLTYALGRGMDYQDEYAVETIAARLEQDGGRFSTLIDGIIESAQFQKRRPVTRLNASATSPAIDQFVQTREQP